VFSSAAPICSAIDMNRLLNTSSMTGSASVPSATRCGKCWPPAPPKQHSV